MTDIANNDELLTLSEVASYLKVAEKTIHRMVKKGEIPCFKVASQWRFKKSGIDAWLHSKLQTTPSDETTRLLEESPELVPFSRLTTTDLIIEDVKAGNKEEILKQMIQPLLSGELLEKGDDYLKKLLDREKMISTGIGNGIALPHIRNPQENPSTVPAVVIGRCEEGAEYDSLDGKKTYLFFLIFTNSIKVHLRLTSRINRILMNKEILEKLKKTQSKTDLYKLIIEEDHVILELEKESQRVSSSPEGE
ncbi:MAG: PTS sugar transporter subunit IIA [Spirochaetales bacterium]|nr:PTS sugar transporter subunit IIA [Spirochaetales bacterium]